MHEAINFCKPTRKKQHQITEENAKILTYLRASQTAHFLLSVVNFFL